ncbi:hypothetical protein NUW54_g6793 [Trametes sanguinea]|uniref:Uncharacterized protein n=1 Tax=Trametes sanguinea TaxID=158606 RepID=A0ACC1PT27_9APHY|nr:hypothetical protein NUW54_g6793 [Trametes sanguinea]
MSPVRKRDSAFRTPSAPWRVRDAQPTLTRTFRARTDGSRRKGKDRHSRADVESDSDDVDVDGNDIEDPASGLSTSGQIGDAASSIARSAKPEVFVDFEAHSISAARNKGKSRSGLTRYPSVTSIASNDDAHPSRQGSVSSWRSSSRPPAAGSGGDAPIWTRFGMQNGEPVFIRDSRCSSTKDKDCITSWWESSSRAPLREPPDLSDKPDLALGDLYCNHVIGIDAPQLWIWTTDGWKPIAEGDMRASDNRRLSITPKKKLPSWVKGDWCLKQMVKHHKVIVGSAIEQLVKDPFDPSRFDFEDASTTAGRMIRLRHEAQLHDHSLCHGLSERRQVHFAPAVSIADEDQLQKMRRRTSAGRHDAKPRFFTFYRTFTWICITVGFLSICLATWSGSPGFGALSSQFLESVQARLSNLDASAAARPPPIPPLVLDHIQQAIRIALESTVPRYDFALARLGGNVIDFLTHPDHLRDADNYPHNVLTEELHHDACWNFPGDHGQVAIRLSRKITPSHVALDFNLSFGLVRAPRDIVLWGVVDGTGNRLAYDIHLQHYRDRVSQLGPAPAHAPVYTFLPMASFQYDPLSPFALQTFSVERAVQASGMSFGLVVVEIRSNWGGNRTAVCRIRVHGEPTA